MTTSSVVTIHSDSTHVLCVPAAPHLSPWSPANSSCAYLLPSSRCSPATTTAISLFKMLGEEQGQTNSYPRSPLPLLQLLHLLLLLGRKYMRAQLGCNGDAWDACGLYPPVLNAFNTTFVQRRKCVKLYSIGESHQS